MFNFVDEISGQIMHNDGISLRSAYAGTNSTAPIRESMHILPMYAFKEDLKEYFGKFEERAIVNDAESGVKEKEFALAGEELMTGHERR